MMITNEFLIFNVKLLKKYPLHDEMSLLWEYKPICRTKRQSFVESILAQIFLA